MKTFHILVEKQNPYQFKNRRRRRCRFYVRCKIYCIYQGQQRQYAGRCTCVYGVCSVKNIFCTMPKNQIYGPFCFAGRTVNRTVK
jgi:hypothetical protein